MCVEREVKLIVFKCTKTKARKVNRRVFTCLLQKARIGNWTAKIYLVTVLANMISLKFGQMHDRVIAAQQTAGNYFKCSRASTLCQEIPDDRAIQTDGAHRLPAVAQDDEN